MVEMTIVMIAMKMARVMKMSKTWNLGVLWWPLLARQPITRQPESREMCQC